MSNNLQNISPNNENKNALLQALQADLDSEALDPAAKGFEEDAAEGLQHISTQNIAHTVATLNATLQKQLKKKNSIKIKKRIEFNYFYFAIILLLLLICIAFYIIKKAI